MKPFLRITHTHVVVSLGIAIVVVGTIMLMVYVNDTSKTVPEVISGTVNEFTQVAKGNFATTTPAVTKINPADITSVVFMGTSTPGVTAASSTFAVDVALTEAAREKGLSGRTSLKQNTGLLFVFDAAEEPLFWMKDMNFSIDITWIDDSMKVVHIEKNVSPNTYPKTFSSPVPSRFVLETPAGSMKAHKISVGDAVVFMTSH